MGRLFGTDGVRGIANSELTPNLAFNLGKAGTYVLKKEKERPVVLIGKDTRISGDMLEEALAAGVLSMGGDVIRLGIIPTPAVAYLVRYYRADMGVVITASHNPFEYNGIKIFKGDGFKLEDETEDQIEDIIVRDIDINSHIVGEKMGKALDGQENAQLAYAEFLKAAMRKGEESRLPLEGLRLVIDCANGASYKVAERVFRDLGAELTVIGNTPDGMNINDACGSTHPERLQNEVIKRGADLGLAFDGDADRLIAVDEKGRLMDGDKVVCICAKMLKAKGELVHDLVTATVMSNIGFHKACAAMGAKVDVTGVGDRYVLESMRKSGGIIGGEQSGHIIFLNHTTTGDGILSGLMLIKAVRFLGRKASELSDEIMSFPQVLKNASVKNENKNKYAKDPEIRSEMERIEEEMAGSGRVLIRPSGTEPLVRVMIEGPDIEEITELAEGLAMLITRKFG